MELRVELVGGFYPTMTHIQSIVRNAISIHGLLWIVCYYGSGRAGSETMYHSLRPSRRQEMSSSLNNTHQGRNQNIKTENVTRVLILSYRCFKGPGIKRFRKKYFCCCAVLIVFLGFALRWCGNVVVIWLIFISYL